MSTFLKPRYALSLLTSLVLAGACTPNDLFVPSPIVTSPVVISNQPYDTVSIGGQSWTATNYRGPGGIAHNPADEKAVYGRYYTVQEAKAVTLPTGWRLPTLADWQKLVTSQGIVLTNNRAAGQEAIKRLVSKTAWRTAPGTNASGFNAYPTGYSSQHVPPQEGDVAEFWTAEGYSMSIQDNGSGLHTLLFYNNAHDPTARFTIRFVSDN